MFALSDATTIAGDFIGRLGCACERVQIAGSIRRRVLSVRDIDLVVLPRQAATRTFFGAPDTQDLLGVRLLELKSRGMVDFQSNGPRYKRIFYAASDAPIPIDIYVATPESWWTTVLVRTGSRLHNIAMAGRALERHLVLRSDGSGIFSAGGLPLTIRSEEEAFHILGVPYKQPEERE